MKVKKLNENFELIEKFAPYTTDERYYVYNAENDVVSDSFEYEDDAIEWAEEHNYPTVKIHRYYRENEDSTLDPDGEPEVIWSKSINECDDRSAQAIKDYRDFANIDESFEITEDNIDAWALNEAAVKNSIQSYDLKHRLLGEDVTIDQAARDLEAETARAESQNQVDKVLDRSLKIAKRKQKSGDTGDFPNILLISDAGFGKTDMVRQWAKKNGINLVQKNLGTMGPEAFGGIVARDADDPRYATRLGTNEMIKALEKPNSVLFLDEYNRSKTEVRGAVLTLVQNHMVWDPTEENQEKFLENFLFTVAAINPPNAAYKGAKEMDPAELSRFYSVNMQPDPMEHLKYLKGFYSKKIAETEDAEEKLEYQGKLALAEKILNDPSFTYDGAIDIEENQDNPSYKPLNYRSFKMALDYSDGTKDDFLDVWNHYCNPKKKRKIEDILGDYVDVADKANAALKDGSKSSVFTKEVSNLEKLKNAFPELDL